MAQYIWDFNAPSGSNLKTFDQWSQEQAQKNKLTASAIPSPGAKTYSTGGLDLYDPATTPDYLANRIAPTVTPDNNLLKGIGGAVDKVENSKLWRTVIGNPEEGFGVGDMAEGLLMANPAGSMGVGIKTLGKAAKATPAIAKAGQAIDKGVNLLKGIAAKTPTPIKAGVGIGTAATVGETTAGAINPDYVNPISGQQTFPSKFGSSLHSGAGDAVGLVGSVAKWQGYDELGNSLKNKGEKISEGFEPNRTEFKGWQSFLDPEWYANNVAATLPTTASLIPLMIAGYMGGGKIGAKALKSKAGQKMVAKKFSQEAAEEATEKMTPFVKNIFGSLGGTALSRPLESAMEAGGTYEDALARGMNEDQARTAANRVFTDNLKLAGMDVAQLALTFAPTGKIASKMGKALTAGGKVVGDVATESLEEGLQQGIQQRATGADTRGLIEQMRNPTTEMQESMAIGGLLGGGMGAVGAVKDMVTTIKQRTIAELPDDAMPTIQQRLQQITDMGASPAEAIDQVLDEVSDSPGVKATVERITQEEAASTIEKLSSTVSGQEPGKAAPIDEGAQPAAPSDNNEAAIDVVYTNSGTPLQIIDQSSPAVYVVQDQEGKRSVVSRDDVSEPAQIPQKDFASPKTAKVENNTAQNQAESGDIEPVKPVNPSGNQGGLGGQSGTNAANAIGNGPSEPVDAGSNATNDIEDDIPTPRTTKVGDVLYDKETGEAYTAVVVGSGGMLKVKDSSGNEKGVKYSSLAKTKPGTGDKPEANTADSVDVAKLPDHVLEDIISKADQVKDKPGNKELLDKVKAEHERRGLGKTEKEPEKKPDKKPTPDRKLKIQRGKHGAVDVVFPDSVHADLFAFNGRLQRQIKGEKKYFDTAQELKRLALSLGLPADALNKGDIAGQYKAAVMKLISGLPAGASYEAPRLSDLSDLVTKKEPEKAPDTPNPVDMAALKAYAEEVVKSGEVEAVYLIGSTAAKGSGKDIDLLYQLKDQELPESEEDATGEIESIVESLDMDLDQYDTFIQVGERYFHLSSGAGREFVENNDYANENKDKPKVLLAKTEKVEPAGKEVGDFIITKTKHTKTGADMWVVRLKDGNQLPTDEFKKLAARIKALGGSRWSKFSKGFNFYEDPTEKLQPKDEVKSENPKDKTGVEPGRAVPIENAFEQKRMPKAPFRSEQNEQGGWVVYDANDLGWLSSTNKEEAQKQIDELNKEYGGEAKAESKPTITQEVPKSEPIKNKDRSPEWLAKMKADAEARIQANKSRLLSGLPMDDLLDYGIIGMVKLIEKGLDFAAFSKEMIDEYGPVLKNWMAAIFAQSNALIEMTEEDLNQMIEDSRREGSKPEAETKPEVAIKPQYDSNQKIKATGNTVTVKTERGTEVEVQYALVEIKDLIASHTTGFTVNSKYPGELQPRDRSRAASEIQVTKMAQDIEPSFLGESPKASDGAPIIGPDLVVESGNGRALALQLAYGGGYGTPDKYLSWLRENVKKLGIDPQTLDEMKAPVLVRIRRTEVDRAKFAREANEQATAAMSATEQAMSDAKSLSLSLLELFYPSEDGTILNRANDQFILGFMQEVIGPTETGRYITADKSISQEGASRIRNAIFAKAYGDVTAIGKLAESTDNNIKNITNAMLAVAPKFAKMKSGIENGSLYDLDITPELADAARKLSHLKEQGQAVVTYLNQLTMFNNELSPLAKDLLSILDTYNRSSKRLASILSAYVDGVLGLGEPSQGGLWGGDKLPSRADVLLAAIKEKGGDLSGNVQTNLFDYKPEESKPNATSDQAGGTAAEQGQDEPTPERSVPVAESESSTLKIAKWVQEKIDKNERFSNQELFNAAKEFYGGGQAEARFTPKDAYDAMELGVNLWLLSRSTALHLNGTERAMGKVENAKKTVKYLQQRLLDLFPTMRNRTAEMDEFQQFSTPPSIAYIAAWVANISSKDTVLEPSAGIGGLAVFGKIAGAKVIVNELSERRAEVLREMNFDRLFTENAEQINNILPKDVKPTVVIMNPPFSSTAGRIKGKNKTRNATTHIEQALKRLEPGGRLVAIVGRGMANKTPTFRDWWDSIRTQYTVQANIGINGDNYTKYGTGFDVQIVVIDKIGPNQKDTVVGRVDNLEDILPLLEAIRNDRPQTSGTAQQNADQSVRQPTTQEGETASGTGHAAPIPTDNLGTGEQPGANSGRSGTGGGSRPDGSGRTGTSNTNAPEANGSVDQNGTSTGSELGGNIGAANNENGQGSSAVPSGTTEGSTKKPDATGDRTGTIEIGAKETEKTAETELGDAVYSRYKPQKLKVKGAKPHPADLVQSSAMASVDPPDPTYRPNLPKEVIDEGKLSEAQIEAVVYAGQAHQETLPDGQRRGFFIGDGTGVGKAREIGAIILDNMRQGRTKAVWVSENIELVPSVKEQYALVGGDPSVVIEHGKIKTGTGIKQNDGILFTTYNTLGQGQVVDRNGGLTLKNANVTSRLDQLVNWLGEDFDGVIAFDEAHNMQNSLSMGGGRGSSKPAGKAVAGVELQRRLPNARVVYASATGATEVANLAYCDRLGLWGRGTPFANKRDFIAQIASSGLAAMELVARDMKSMGAYIARNIGFTGVSYSTLEHTLTKDQREIYDTMAEGWQIVLQNIMAALMETNAVDPDTGANNLGNGAKAKAMSAFWGAQQRFFNQILTSMQMPTAVKAIKEDIADGKAVVLQLVNTNEAQFNRSMADLEEGDSLEDLDMTPRAQLVMFLENSFPVGQFEPFTDEDGNTQTRPVLDSEGNRVENPEAVAMRDELLEKIGAMKVPDGPLEILLNEFGPDVMAEITGRKRRVVTKLNGQTGRMEKIAEQRSKNDQMADENAFMDDRKQVLVFSDAGGTGRSYHADNTRKNQRQRKHYLIQAGWTASKAVQGFGRTHRSNQASSPEYVLVTTDLKGQKRFMSSIARRLDQLGALTKGQRQAGGQGLFSEKDNLEGPMASDALLRFYNDLISGHIPELSAQDLMPKLGLDALLDEHGNLKEDPRARKVTLFLNRLLTLDSSLQNRVFDEFFGRMESMVERAVAAGQLDTGMENFKADKSVVIKEETVFKDKHSGAETKLIEFEAYHKIRPLTYKEIAQIAKARWHKGYVRNTRSGKLYALQTRGDVTTSSGQVVDGYYLYDQDKGNRSTTDQIAFDKGSWEFIETRGWTIFGPNSKKPYAVKYTEQEAKEYIKMTKEGSPWIDESKFRIEPPENIEELWNKAVDDLPEYRKQKVHLITGALLPIWDRLPDGKFRVVRVLTEDSRILLGRVIPERSLDITLSRLGAGRSGETEFSAADVVGRIMAGAEARLSNGWRIVKRTVSGESRIEIIAEDIWKYTQEIIRAGGYSERVNYKTRYFIPTNQTAAVSCLEALTEYRPIAEVIDSGGVSLKAGSNKGKTNEGAEAPIFYDPNELLDELSEKLGRKMYAAPEAMERDDMQAAAVIANLLTQSQLIPMKGEDAPQGAAYGPNVFVGVETEDPHLYVAMHEIEHTLEDVDPEAHDEFMAIAKKYFNGATGMSDYYFRHGYSYKDIWKEFTADVTAEIMQQPGFWAKVREQSPALIKKIVDIIDQIITKFRKEVAKDSSMLKYISDIEAFRDEVAGATAKLLKKKPRNLLDLRGAEAFAAKVKEPGQRTANKPLMDVRQGDLLKGPDGKPLKVYHGTSARFDTFDQGKLGSNTGSSSSKEGFFFTDNPNLAQFYGEGNEPDNEAFAQTVSDLVDKDIISLLSNNGELLDEFRDNADSDYYGVAPGDIPTSEIRAWLKSRGIGDSEVNTADGAIGNGFYDSVREMRVFFQRAGLKADGIQYKQGNVREANLVMNRPYMRKYADTSFDDIGYTQIIKEAKKRGHDGVIIENARDPMNTNLYIVFSADQIVENGKAVTPREKARTDILAGIGTTLKPKKLTHKELKDEWYSGGENIQKDRGPGGMKTSIAQIPTGMIDYVKWGIAKVGGLHLDNGAGRLDKGQIELVNQGVTSVPMDAFNRSEQRNQRAYQAIKDNGGADSANSSNVLNVIRHMDDAIEHIKFTYGALKPGGKLIINVYEGTKKNAGVWDGSQQNRPTKWYQQFVEYAAPDASISYLQGGKFMVVEKPANGAVEFRDYKQGYYRPAGKSMMGRWYLHKDYVDDLKAHVPAGEPDLMTPLAEKFKGQVPFEYNIINVNQKGKEISFLYSPDFDTATEPRIEKSINFKADGKTSGVKNFKEETAWIYHGKHEFVREDYKGFDYSEAEKRWSQWTSQGIAKELGFSSGKIGSPKVWAQVTPHIGGQVSFKHSKGSGFNLPNQHQEVQDRMEGARGVPAETLRERMKEIWDEVVRKTTREFEHLPRGGTYAELRNSLLLLRKQKGIAADKTLKVLNDITKPLNEYEYDVFSYKVIFDDLAHEFEENHLLPFGLTEENFEDIKEYVDEEAAKLPKVQEAIEKRRGAWNKAKNDYIQAQKAVGFNVEDRLKKEDYFRHQVLEYANGKGVMGSGKRLRVQTGRGFLKKRGGSTYDINTDYLQAEFEVMAQMIVDTASAGTVKVVKENHDIVKELKREAVHINDQGMLQEFQRLLDIMQDTETTPEQLYRRTLNRKQAIAYSQLYKLAAMNELPNGGGKWDQIIEVMSNAYWDAKEANANDEEGEGGTYSARIPDEYQGQLMAYLNYLAGQDESEVGKIKARTVFKGMAQKVKTIQKTLGTRYVTWEDLVPDGYTAWQPQEGHMFFMADSIPQNMAEQLLYGIADEINIDATMLKKVMVAGQKYPELVIPDEVAATLETLYKDANLIGPAAKWLFHVPYRAWKQWQLISPRRFFKYNVRNTTGDLDAVLAGNPSALRPKILKKAWGDLKQGFFSKDREYTRSLQGWFERGGFETLMQAQEINDINRNRQFQHLMESRMQKDLWEKAQASPKTLWNGYWDTVRATTDFREALMRYACYLDYLEQMQANHGIPKNFGASNRAEVMALPDIRDRAAKLSNELLGAYDEVSVVGTWLADHLFPFWRWNEVNFVRYMRLGKNAWQDGQLCATTARKFTGLAIRSPLIAAKIGKFVLQATALTVMINLWNLLFFDDEDKELPDDVRNRLHITFGRDSNGNVLYFSRLGALQDFLDWFGLDTPVKTAQDFLSGRKSLLEIATDWGKADANKVLNAITPFIKTPFELISDRKFYPDVFEAMPIRDRWQYVFDSFGLGNEYKALPPMRIPIVNIELGGKPSRGYGNSIPDLFIYKSDPYETAYYKNKENVIRFRKKIGTYNEGYSESIRSDALYNVKLAMRYGDKEAAQRYLLKYASLGGTVKGLNTSLKSLSPVYGLNEAQTEVYIKNYLDVEGKENLAKAIDYYQRVVGGDMFSAED